MATISYDGQSFLIDGRRIWLVSGAIHYVRTPHQLWRSRIRAAKQAGLNCIETHVFWNVHEPEPGKFYFEGNADLRQFIQLIGEEGLYCILRPGPFIGSEWDFGGLPPWLNRVADIRFREANGSFMEACSRSLTAVMDQVRDLQLAAPVTGRSAAAATGGGGPIIMMQAENQWYCHNPEQGQLYLREIVRYLREAGCAVPISVANNLWQRVDGAIDTWNAAAHLAADLRQLRCVQRDAPRLVSEYRPGTPDHWGSSHHTAPPPDTLAYHLASMLAVGAQCNLFMFHGGTNFGFYGGRRSDGRGRFATTSYGCDAPLLEAGGRGQKYDVVKRLCTFSSQFAQLLANLDPNSQHTAVSLDGDDHAFSVIQQTGSQGQLIFLISALQKQPRQVHVMLPDGQTLPVPIDPSGVAWIVLDANLGGVAELTYTNLRPWAFLGGQLLVLFGPAEARGLVCINGTPLSLKVPSGQKPLVTEHEDLAVVLLNVEQVDATYLLPNGLVVGAAGLDQNDKPIARPHWPNATRIVTNGKTSVLPMKTAKQRTSPPLGNWRASPISDLIQGTSGAFEPIDGPASLEQLKCDHGYGLYRIMLKSPIDRRKMLVPRSGDRLHVYVDGRRVALLGQGPGAIYKPVNLTLGQRNVILADNLGRFSDGWDLGEPKGLYGHFYEVRPVTMGKPEMVSGSLPGPFTLRGFYSGLRADDQSPVEGLRWEFKPAVRKPMILDIGNLSQRAMLIINDVPQAMYDPVQCGRTGRFLLEPGQQITGGKNVLVLALFEAIKRKSEISRVVKLYQTTGPLTAKADWAFMPLSTPEPDAFKAIADLDHQPCWYRCTFRVSHTDVPLWFEPQSLSKGQISINGHNAGRYFVRTHTGTAVPPQERYYLPEPWLQIGQINELMIFDEHGHDPRGARLVYDQMGPYG